MLKGTSIMCCEECEIHHGRLPQGISVEDFLNLVTSLGFGETQLYKRGTETHMIVRIAIVHPRLGRGGSEARALWAIEALKGSYGVSLVTMGEVDFPSLNAYYGMQLSLGDVAVLRA